MRTTAEKSSHTSSTSEHQKSAQPFFAKAGGGDFFAPVNHSSPSVQTKLTVNKPGDKFEQEADKMADKVMRMPAPATPAKEEKIQRAVLPEEKVQKKEEEKIQKATLPEEKVQKKEEEKIQKAALPEEKVQKKEEDRIQKATLPEEKVQKKEEEKIQKATLPEEKVQKKEEEKLQRDGGNGSPAVAADTQSSIRSKTSGGQPLSTEARSYMEPRFNADFSNVRIHSDPESAGLSNQLSARAFTYQNHVFFSRDQYQPGTSEGKQLLAHELTHTIQQGHAIQRSPQVTTTATPPPVQRLGIQDALDYFADKAYNLPGFRMLTIIMGFNPINMRSTDRSAANILRALIELVPGGHLITQALDNHGVFTKAGAWVEQQLSTLGNIGADIVSGLKRFIDSLSWTDIFDLGGVWNRAVRIFTDPIGRLISFAQSVVSGILKMVKDAILKPLAALAQGTRGYDLLKAILGEDPITGEAVPRNADTLIGGFMKLIGQEEIWENIKKGNAIGRAWAWFQGALAGLMGFVRAIPRRIVDTISSLTFQDIITVVGALSKIIGAFVNIAGEFISWGLNQVISLLEILFSVVAPGVMPYIAKARAAFTTIIKNPIAFVGNLVRAGKLGFEMFASNILTHLKTALIRWITGPLGDAGVYIPKSFSLMEIIKLVLSVLGLTWQNIRSKLVKIIPEPVLVVLEKTAGILVTLVTEGPAAAWEQIKTELSELKDQMIAKITEMISTEVVKAAIMKLVSMLNPAGAVIQAIIAIYNTVTFFIQKINQIAAVVASFIDSIAAIASGQVENAAKKVEQTMANTLTIIIAFLAKFAGLGNIPEKIVGIIKKIRQPIDKGLDKIVGWLGGILNKVVGGAKNLAAGVLQWWKQRKSFKDNTGSTHNLYFEGESVSAKLMVASTVMTVEATIAAASAKASSNEEKQNVIDARLLKTQAETIIKKLQGKGKDAYDPKDIDSINSLLEKLAQKMALLLPLISGPVASSPTSLSVIIGDLVNYNGRHWIVSSFGKVGNLDMVYIKRLIPAIKSSNADGFGVPGFDKDLKSGKVMKVSDTATRRSLFVGSTPSKSSGVGNLVKNRMITSGKFNTKNGQFFNARDGKWYPLSQADMGHVIDASTWWNSNGRFKGPKSPEVRTFMNDPDNYEFEESGQNQARGSSSPNYLPPAF